MRGYTLAMLLGVAALSMGMANLDRRDLKSSQAERLFARATEDDYMGDLGCVSCHESKTLNFVASPHAAPMSDLNLPLNRRGCEGCHGPGNIHQAEENDEVLDFRAMTPKESSAACMRCHEKTLSANHWGRTEHARANLSCVSCHQIHTDTDPAWEKQSLKKGQNKDPRRTVQVARFEPKSLLKAEESVLCGQCHAPQVAEFRQPSHHPIPEARMACSDCHSPHPTKALKTSKDMARGQCVTCHVEYAGPFVFEHDPVAGHTGDGCMECHKPHGSAFGKMLNSRTRGLCAQCHTEKLGKHFPGQSCWNAGCHVASHGSNSDPKFLKP